MFLERVNVGLRVQNFILRMSLLTLFVNITQGDQGALTKLTTTPISTNHCLPQVIHQNVANLKHEVGLFQLQTTLSNALQTCHNAGTDLGLKGTV